MTSNQLDILAGVITYLHTRIIDLKDYEDIVKDYVKVRKEIAELSEELENVQEKES